MKREDVCSTLGVNLRLKHEVAASRCNFFLILSHKLFETAKHEAHNFLLAAVESSAWVGTSCRWTFSA